MARPFESVKLIDLTHVLAGPFATFQLAVLGADVVKVESPDHPDCARGRGPDPQQNNALRGLNYQVQGAEKRSLTLNLKKAQAQEILRKLVSSADVFVENYRTGKMEELGLGYDELSSINPGLIYCSMTGFGGVGPRAGVGAYDNVIQATSGVVSRTGVKPALSFIDYAAGLSAAFAISSALFQRQRDGRGQRIDCSMFETALMLMAPEMAAELRPNSSTRPKEAGLLSYDTIDGTLMLGVFTPLQNRQMWNALAEDGFDAADFGNTPDWESLWAKSEDMRLALTGILKTRTAEAWQQWFHTRDLPAETVRPLDQAVRDPQLSVRRFLRPLPVGDGDGETPVLAAAAAFNYERDGPEITRTAPSLGEHTWEILQELGFQGAEIEALQAEGVV